MLKLLFFIAFCVFHQVIEISGETLTSNQKRKFEDIPYEILYYRIPKGENRTYERSLKYPPYKRCVLPDRVAKKSAIGGGSTARNWRLYWSRLIWDAYFFSNGDEVVNWEWLKTYGLQDNDYFMESGEPMLVLLVGLTIEMILAIILFPLFSMVIFRGMFMIHNLLTNKWIVKFCRFLIIKNARYRRDSELRIFRDAGHRPPFYRYSLPKFVRDNEHEAVPKELDETDEEFWSSSDEEILANKVTTTIAAKSSKSSAQLQKQKPTPEFTPEYPTSEQKTHVISDEMFAYLMKVKRYGMFAVWTEGVTEIKLADIILSDYAPKKIKTNVGLPKYK